MKVEQRNVSDNARRKIWIICKWCHGNKTKQNTDCGNVDTSTIQETLGMQLDIRMFTEDGLININEERNCDRKDKHFSK